jgi:hypothetical protein
MSMVILNACIEIKIDRNPNVKKRSTHFCMDSRFLRVDTLGDGGSY